MLARPSVLSCHSTSAAEFHTVIGIFLVNPKGQLCLTRYDAASKADIAWVTYLPASRIVALTFTDQSEEVLVTETTDQIHKALVDNAQLLVANLDDASTLQREYVVDIRK